MIPFPASTWRFFDYFEAAVNPIEEWYLQLSEETQYKFWSLLKLVSKTENHLGWMGFKFLNGEPKEERIWQLDFFADRRQYRLLGVFGNSRKTAVLLIGCFHKGRNYTPPNALETACKRAKALRLGRADTRERKINLDQ